MSQAGLLAAQRCLQRPLPTGDPAWFRASAGRSAGLAAELRRVDERLSGCARGLDWSGMAQREFARAIAVQAPELAVIAGRYEGYSVALTGYADVLDQLQPALLALRYQLADGIGTPAPAAVAELGDDRLRQLAARFDQTWQDWQGGLRRCRQLLGQAAAIERDHRGWSSFAHRVIGAVAAIAPVVRLIEDPSLAGLSSALGDLGTELVVVGLVLLVVFPPGAALCFGAAAAVSAAQLATDAVRAGRHDPGVGRATLGLDALGALPGGRLVREGEQGVRAARALERLAPGQRVTRLVPGGGLAAHEAAGGHTLQKHVGRTPQELLQRLQQEPRTFRSSSFYDRGAAEDVLSDLLNARHGEIGKWLQSGSGPLAISGACHERIGVTVTRAIPGGSHVSGVFALLRKDPSTSLGYHIHTAFPRP